MVKLYPRKPNYAEFVWKHWSWITFSKQQGHMKTRLWTSVARAVRRLDVELACEWVCFLPVRRLLPSFSYMDAPKENTARKDHFTQLWEAYEGSPAARCASRQVVTVNQWAGSMTSCLLQRPPSPLPVSPVLHRPAGDSASFAFSGIHQNTERREPLILRGCPAVQRRDISSIFTFLTCSTVSHATWKVKFFCSPQKPHKSSILPFFFLHL